MNMDIEYHSVGNKENKVLSNFKIGTLNINKNINSELLNILQLIKEHKLDILLLQETANLSEKSEIILQNAWDGSYTSNIRGKRRNGGNYTNNKFSFKGYNKSH